MKKKQQAQPEFTIDADGQRLAHIALANTDLWATLYAEDYQRLMDSGFSPHWQYAKDGRGNAYATLSAYTSQGVDCLVSVARLIAQAKAGQSVRYVDDNPLNLRTENLKLTKGAARYGAVDWYPDATAVLDAGRTLKAAAWREGSRPPRKPATPHSVPKRSTELPAAPWAPAEPVRAYTPHVRDTAATSARVRVMLAAGTP